MRRNQLLAIILNHLLMMMLHLTPPEQELTAFTTMVNDMGLFWIYPI